MIILFVTGTLLMIIMPLFLASLLEKRGSLDWGLFGVGAATFVMAQFLHIPFNLLVDDLGLLPTDLEPTANLLLVTLFLGLSAGLFEEVARYLAYRYWAQDARDWWTGLMMGAGHGGVEAIILGLIGLANILAYSGIRQGYFTSLVSPEQLPLVEAGAQALADAGWYDALLAPAERAFALTAHLALSLLVLQVFVRGRNRWLVLAIAWHTILDAVTVFTTLRWGVYVAEGALASITVINLALIAHFRYQHAPEKDPELDPPPVVTLEMGSKRHELLSEEKLERSRFQ